MNLTQALIKATESGCIKWRREESNVSEPYWSAPLNGMVVNVDKHKIQVSGLVKVEVSGVTTYEPTSLDYEGSYVLRSSIEKWYSDKDNRKQYAIEQVVADALNFQYDGKGNFK